MIEYLDLLNEVIAYGTLKEDRTGTGTRSLFGRQIRFRLDEGFPLLTTKKIHTKSIIHELLWFISGDTNIKYLNDNGVTIWDSWADENGDLGPVYGKQWRDFNGVDQLKGLVDGLASNPYGRRHIITAWNPSEIEDMALPPCHCLMQFNCRPYGKSFKLDCQLYQRSADIFLGVPFNIASYALLTHMLAGSLGYTPGEFVHTFGDLHLYSNHTDQAFEQLSRKTQPRPNLELRKVNDLFSYTYDDISIIDYNPAPAIKAPVAV